MVQVPHYALADIRSVNMIVVRILAVIPVLDRFRKPHRLRLLSKPVALDLDAGE